MNQDALAETLFEVPCAECGETSFVFPATRGATHSAACPKCKKQTFATVDKNGGIKWLGESEVTRRALLARQRICICCSCGIKLQVAKIERFEIYLDFVLIHAPPRQYGDCHPATHERISLLDWEGEWSPQDAASS